MQLSKHFTLAEMVESSTAKKLNIQNTPSFGVIQNLGRLCTSVLEPLRMHVGKPVVINSGYRCEKLNRAVGGAWNSNHLYGYAADIRINNNTEGQYWFEWIKNNCNFDELIWETADGINFWIHVAYRHGRNRKKVVDFLRK